MSGCLILRCIDYSVENHNTQSLDFSCSVDTVAGIVTALLQADLR